MVGSNYLKIEEFQCFERTVFAQNFEVLFVFFQKVRSFSQYSKSDYRHVRSFSQIIGMLDACKQTKYFVKLIQYGSGDVRKATTESYP